MVQPEVIIVEDNEVIQYLHSEIVNMAGIGEKISTFLNGKEALSYLNQHNSLTKPILVLLDINMPVMNGWEFLDALPQISGNKFVYVAVVTSSVDLYDRKKAFSFQHVIDFIEKPIDETSLIRQTEIINEKSIKSDN